MKNTLRGALLSALFTPVLVVAGPAAIVTTGANDGPGSLRQALTYSNKIIIAKPVKKIEITETLVYAGYAPLKLKGSGQVIDGSSLSDTSTPIFMVSQGADLNMSNLSLQGPGGFSRDRNQDEGVSENGGKGIYLQVPTDRTGEVKVKLNNISVANVGNHGIHISDCTLGDDCGSGSGGGGDGSPASVSVHLNQVSVVNVGFGKADADGLRVDERNEGDIRFTAFDSEFVGVGADGVELDEGNNGDVILAANNLNFIKNGFYCNQGNFDPEDTQAPCNDDGDRDVDDGFDIDEAGQGSIKGKIKNIRVVDNYDEGLDFDEEDEGGYELKLVSIFANGNEDEGIKISEENEGDVKVQMRKIKAPANNGNKEGIEIEEENQGTVAIIITGSQIPDEVKVEQEIEGEEGNGTLKVRNSVIEDFDLENVDQI